MQRPSSCRTRHLRRLVLPLFAIPAACGPGAIEPLPPGQFAFAVFGDAPYRAWETGRFRRVIEDVNEADLQWFLHVGDILWFPCSDDVFQDRLEAMNSIRHPVIYTPGDNEWTDCHEDLPGRYAPLERLDRLREIFYSHPGVTLGGRSIQVETQGADPVFGEFVENVRWRRGGFVFATIHAVGSGNGLDGYTGRTQADDEEVRRRTAAGLAWLEEAFTIATTERLHGVVLALHADMDLVDGASRPGHASFVDRLAELTAGFPGQVLLIHGDSHEFIVDQPLTDSTTGKPLTNFTRLETFGSPDVGWVRVVMDSVAGRIVGYDGRLQPGWRFW